jgi:hypothetical protein
MASLTLDPESIQSIASAAIFDSLSAEARENVVKQAIQHLLTPEKDRNHYNYGKTPLQRAFDQAIYSAAQKAVDDAVKNDPAVKARIDELLGPLITGAIDELSANYQDDFALKVGQALGNMLSDAARDRR